MGVVLLKKVKTELFSWHVIGNGQELRLCLQQRVVHELATACYWQPVSHSFSLSRRAWCDAELCIYRISACFAHLVLRSTACTGKLTPAFRRLRPSLPLESCPIRPCARRPSTWPPTLPRDPSTRLDRMRGRRGFRGWQVEEKKEGPIHLKLGCLVFVPPPHRWIQFGSRGRLRVSAVIKPGEKNLQGTCMRQKWDGQRIIADSVNRNIVWVVKTKNGKLYKSLRCCTKSRWTQALSVLEGGKKSSYVLNEMFPLFFMHCVEVSRVGAEG